MFIIVKKLSVKNILNFQKNSSLLKTHSNYSRKTTKHTYRLTGEPDLQYNEEYHGDRGGQVEETIKILCAIFDS
jgi:hypothetical protein